jgi:hypothetical protein
VPIPDGLIGNSGNVEGPQEPVDRCEPEQPVGHLPGNDAEQVRRGRGEDQEALLDSAPEVEQVLCEPEQEQEQDEQDQRDDDQRPAQVREHPVEVEAGQAREHGPSWKRARGERVGDEARRGDEVEERQRDERRRQRRVGGPTDAVLDDVEARDVAGAGRHDRVHAYACDVPREDAPPGHAFVRVGRGDDVPPGRADAAELRELTRECGGEGGPADVGQVAEEDSDVVEDRVQ